MNPSCLRLRRLTGQRLADAVLSVCAKHREFIHDSLSISSGGAPCFHAPDGEYVHPISCRKYVVCHKGYAFEAACPAHLWFNTDTKECESPASVVCRSRFPCHTPVVLRSLVRSSEAAVHISYPGSIRLTAPFAVEPHYFPRLQPKRFATLDFPTIRFRYERSLLFGS